MEERVPSDQGKLKPMDIPSTTFEVGSSMRKDVTFIYIGNLSKGEVDI
jgi:hypothetical protein